MTGEQQVPRFSGDQWTWSAATNPIPSSADVVIVGGGIVGVSTAYFLARKGVSVALFEKGRIAGEQSGRNWGWVRQQGRSPIELPLMMQSLGVWQGLSAELGEDVGFRQSGSLYLAESPTELEALAEWLPVARAHGLDTRMLSTSALDEVLRPDGVKWAGAMYTASDGRAEPNRASAAIARGAARAGARIFTSCAVRGIERAAGRVGVAITEHGVVATRAGARRILTLPRPESVEVALPETTPPPISCCASAAPQTSSITMADKTARRLNMTISCAKVARFLRTLEQRR